jgi:hypothetical protein
MKLPVNLRRTIARLALLCAAALACGVQAPLAATAAQTEAQAGAPGARAEERAARRARRAEERAARQAIRAEERTARRNARRPRRATGVDTPTAAGEAEANRPNDSSPTGGRGCRLSIVAGSSLLRAGETAELAGTLSCAAGASVSAQQIAIYRHRSGDAAGFSALETVATAGDGSFRIAAGALDANTTFQARLGRLRARTTVKVAPLVTLTAAAPEALASTAGGSPHARGAARRAKFTGTVSPAGASALVALQVAYPASGQQWRTVAFARVAADGTYSLAHAFRIAGVASVRTIVHVAHDAPGISEAIAYVAAQPQNPALTIAASTDPLSYGQPVTISGVATGPTGRPVKLLARTGAGGFAVVAEATTGEGGGYSFSQAPLQNTDFRVVDATEQSTVLFEGVGFALTGAAMPTTAAVGQELTFSGTLGPTSAGQVVHLERQNASGVGFHELGASATDASSQYSIPHLFTSPGTVVLRLRVPGDGRHQTTTSASFTVTVTVGG